MLKLAHTRYRVAQSQLRGRWEALIRQTSRDIYSQVSTIRYLANLQLSIHFSATLIYRTAPTRLHYVRP